MLQMHASLGRWPGGNQVLFSNHSVSVPASKKFTQQVRGDRSTSAILKEAALDLQQLDQHHPGAMLTRLMLGSEPLTSSAHLASTLKRSQA